jgi:hypothetical protein
MSRFKSLTLMLAVCAALTSSIVLADVREKSICPLMPDFRNRDSHFGGECYSGHDCQVGVRGAFLDLTTRASIESAPPNATVTISDKGVEDSRIGQCVPRSNASREGFVKVFLTGITGTGPMRIKLSRPNAFGGQDHDTVTVTVLNGGTYLARLGSTAGSDYVADRNVQKTFTLRGRNLDLLQLKNPVAGDVIERKSEASAEVKLTFTTRGSIGLDTRLEFAGRTPLPNVEGGWPDVLVLVQSNTPPPPAQTAPAPVQPRQGGSQASSPAPSPDLTLTMLNTFRSGPDFTNNEGSTYGLCPSASTDNPKLTVIPNLTIRVQNLGGTVTGAFIVRVLNNGVTRDLTVNGLEAGATKDLLIGRAENRACATKDVNNASICRRCGDGVRGVPHWNDIGITVTVDPANTVTESNEANNARSI